IWYGSWDSVLYQYNQQQQQELLFQKNNQPNSFSNDDILGFAEDTAGNLWMAGRYKGLHLYQRSSGAFFNYRHDPSRDGTIPGNQVNCVYIDRQGILWTGTNKGIGKSSPLQQQFTQFFLPRNAAEHITIHDLYETPQHDCWLATSAGIFVRKFGNNNFNRHTIRYKDTALNVTRFYQDARGRLFIGTNFSLFQLDTAHMSVRPLANTAADGVMNHIIQSSIISIAEDTLEGRPVLITSPYGHYLTYYDWARQQWISRLDSVRQIVNRLNIKDNLIRKLYKSPSSGQLFIATAKEGLGVWQRQRQQFLFYKNDPQKTNVLSNNNVFDMVEDGQQQLWLTTYGGGLHHFTPANGNTVHVAGSNNLLEGIETDASGNVWMISNGNIDKYNPRVSSYASFQLPDIEKTGGVHGRILKDNQGQLYVAGDGYFICFNPLAIKENRQAPAVFLTDFKISNQSHSHLLGNPAIRLPYDQNYISIEFAAPNFASGLPVQYQYRLNGLNENWTDIGTENKVSFSNLPPDTYTFSVRASNRPGTWYENATGIKIIIMSPFWQRWWFYVLALLAVAAVVYAVYHYRINEILSRQAIRNKIAQDLHDNIGSTLSSISVYSQVAKIYKQQKKEQQLQETLEKISETSADMIAEMSDIVWTINPRNDSMDMILQRMESYAKPLLASKSIHCHFTVDEHIRSINPGMTQRKNLYLIFKESINNALKYASCANLYVTLKKEHQIIELLVQDDGVGFNAASLQANMRQSLSGNGLRNIFMRAKEMNGHCEVISSPGQGTTIKLQFPLT
ncbi:MAG TPA: two-component regulator propeller domain-containing protein, partial [Chitinophagaceae bacterium]|nr:two-component regulator propeller domain-containing protein [Chitinophagaceae bacterium]